MEQRALDCNTGLNRELKVEEKLLIQNDKHLQSHITLQERIEELTGRVERLEAATKNIYWEVFDEPNIELRILNPNKQIED